MRQGCVAVWVVLFGCQFAFGQPVTPPPGGTPFFGAPPTERFDEKAAFKGLPPAPTPPPPPKPEVVVVPDGSLPTPPPRKLWTGGFEFGLNGAQGDTNVLNIKFGSQLDRRAESNTFHLDFLYTLNRENGTTSQNQALLNARDELLFPNSPWSLFSAVQLEYDDLRSYDFRIGVYGGFGYKWLENGKTLFKTRAGAGATREINSRPGPPTDRWVPEAVFGFDFNHRFTERQGFVSSMDVYPSLSQLGQYRVRARAAYEIVIDPDHGMVLRLGIQERFDSNPGSGEPNALNYFATLMFRF